ncbi:MAG: hypothetical protein AAB803_02525 [Patescibacteria group bacterium]
MNITDECIAAVFDASKVLPNERNPKQNPKNYRCVGKNVRVTVVDGKSGLVTESWNAAAGVPQGKCLVRYCSGSYCTETKSEDGASGSFYGSSANPLPGGSSGGSALPEQTAGLDAARGEVPATSITNGNPDLSGRLDDAFTQADANRWKVDDTGNPDVTQPVNPALEKALGDRAWDMKAMMDYEKAELLPEVRARPDYQELIRMSDEMKVVPSLQDAWRQAGFYVEPDEPNQTDTMQNSYYGAPSTFSDASAIQRGEGFWSNWRRSENVELQTWSNWASASAQGVINDISDLYQEASYRVSTIWRNMFAK